jgi:hypothetical protein
MHGPRANNNRGPNFTGGTGDQTVKSRDGEVPHVVVACPTSMRP